MSSSSKTVLLTTSAVISKSTPIKSNHTGSDPDSLNQKKKSLKDSDKQPIEKEALNNDDQTTYLACNCSKMSLTYVQDLSTIQGLRKMDLSKNQLATSASIAGLAYCSSLTLLNLSDNALDGVESLKGLKSLQGV
jgi:hypothetical protein